MGMITGLGSRFVGVVSTVEGRSGVLAPKAGREFDTSTASIRDCSAVTLSVRAAIVRSSPEFD
jgi:ribosome maturation factor RimP